MARTLPWLTASPSSSATPKKPRPVSAQKPSARTVKSVDRPGKRQRLSTTLDPAPRYSTDRPASSALDHCEPPTSSPVASPPPDANELRAQLPSAEPMRASGSDAHWRMVEDELLATAQLFTACLHKAEYQRLKREIFSKRDDEFAFGTKGIAADMESTMSMPSRQSTAKQRRERRISMRDIDTGSEDETRGAAIGGDMLIQDPKLARLMRDIPSSSSDRDAERERSGITKKQRFKTRASAGLRSQFEKETNVLVSDARGTKVLTRDEVVKKEPYIYDIPGAIPNKSPKIEHLDDDLGQTMSAATSARILNATPSEDTSPSARKWRDKYYSKHIRQSPPTALKGRVADDDIGFKKAIKVEEIPTFLI